MKNIYSIFINQTLKISSSFTKTSSFLVFSFLLMGLLLPCIAYAVQNNPVSNIVEPGQVPEGLSVKEWNGILERIKESEYEVEKSKDGRTCYMNNPSQNFKAEFCSTGFKTKVNKGDKEIDFGLYPVSYGYEGNLTKVNKAIITDTKNNRVNLDWDSNLKEYHENSNKGLKQNFVINTQPYQRDDLDNKLVVNLASSGGLTPEVSADGQAVHFKDSTGDTVLNYSGLFVYDNRGKKLSAGIGSVINPDSGAVGISLIVDDSGALFPITIDPLLTTETKRIPSDGFEDDYFSYFVSIYGDIVFVGAADDDDNGSNSGSAYIFERDFGGADNWGEIKKLTASDGAELDKFGYSVSIYGDTVIAGAYGDADNGSYSGSIYLFNIEFYWYEDSDNDGYTSGVSAASFERPTSDYFREFELSGTSIEIDCDDSDADEYPGQVWYADFDGDGYTSGETTISCLRAGVTYYSESELSGTSIEIDCNDNDADDEYPGQIWYADLDSDGYSSGISIRRCLQPSGYKLAENLDMQSGDCNDLNSEINPSAVDIADDSIDQNCDGYDLRTWYADNDSDNYGNPGVTSLSNSQPNGYVIDNTDCNDQDSGTYPGATEIAGDGIDQDCDGFDEESIDDNGDGDDEEGSCFIKSVVN